MINIIFRVDSAIEIGTGHVMRCLTLAKQLREKGANVFFICRDFEGNIIRLIRDENFIVYILKKVTEDKVLSWMIENWVLDAEETKEIIKNEIGHCSLLIIDHYGISEDWERMLIDSVDMVMVVDDLANRKHACDILLDQNYYLNQLIRYNNLVPDYCIKLLGPDYLLLREEFLKFKPAQRCDENIENVMVFYGGTDPTAETLKALKALESFNFNITVVVGNKNPHIRLIKKKCADMKRTRLLIQTNEIAKLMRESDIFIGAGGSSLWERCFFKLPSIVTITADNQRELSQTIASQGAIKLLGEYEDVSEEKIKEVLMKFEKNKEVLTKMSERCESLLNIDAIQGRKVSQKILELL